MRRLPLALLTVLALSACPFPEDDTSGETDADTDSDADADVLTSAHTGWKDPCCSDCHPDDDHRKGLDPYECARCHGGNGASGGHLGATPCTGCHPGYHACTGSQFPDPLSCRTCHPDPARGPSRG